MARKPKYRKDGKYQKEDIVRVGKGRFRDKVTGRFVPKNWRRNIAARFYGAMNLKGKHVHAVSTLQYRYSLSETEAESTYKSWLKSKASFALGKLDEEPEGVSDLAEELATRQGYEIKY